MSEPRIIVALDLPDAAAALALAGRLDPGRCRVKVGLELYTAAGPQVLGRLAERGFEVFLDLKLHDIPNTVAGAARAAAAHGCWMLTVHAAGGPAMLAAAAEALAGRDRRPRLVAVTVLTSLDEVALEAIGVPLTPGAWARRLASLAVAAGVDGLVCSPHEAAALRAAHGPEVTLVTPGVRPAGGAAGDQRRVATPAQALAAGSDYLVIGRPITAAPDPAAALAAIERELAVAGA